MPTAKSPPPFSSPHLKKPLFLEGEAGVGKTELAKALSRILGAQLIRLQCYEGLDASHALVRMELRAQLLRIKLAEAEHESARQVEKTIFSEEYLIRRPLLEALTSRRQPPQCCSSTKWTAPTRNSKPSCSKSSVDFQITIPELGTIKAAHPPLVVLTSNRTREIHDALKRRCLYLWIGYPDVRTGTGDRDDESAGINQHTRRANSATSWSASARDFYKRPGVAETIDWGMALSPCTGPNSIRQSSTRPSAASLSTRTTSKHSARVTCPRC